MLRNSSTYSVTLFACLTLGVPAAHATYSLAAVDLETEQVGGAITSCVGSLDVGVVYASAPGFGVVHAQAQLDPFGRGKSGAVERLMQGMAPADILSEITAFSYDFGYASRQYGVVDLEGRAAGFTGGQAQAYAADQQGETGRYVYSVQGNILTGERVLEQTATAFESQGCDLAERLMLALEAGAANGQGDSRCTDEGIPSDSAFIQVDRPGEPAGSYLRLSVADTAPESPLVVLRAEFDAWRVTHPCDETTVVADAGIDGSVGSGPDAGSVTVDASASSDAGGTPNTTPDSDAGADAPRDAAMVDASSRGMRIDAGMLLNGPELEAPRPASTSSGCASGAPRGASSAWTWALATLAILWSRRRRAQVPRDEFVGEPATRHAE